LRKAQDMADLAIAGPKATSAAAAPPPVNVNVGVAVPGGWANVSTPPAPLGNALAALEEEESRS
ncbi:MAG TPA: hypothetical protein VN436_14345, partial [Holophaga sp.]|nr:hypothetical protein [Holophaga sp.]